GDDLGGDGGQAGVLAHRQRVGAAQLDAVVAGRVVAGGEHRAGTAELAGGEVELVGGGQADVHHIQALGQYAVGEGPRQLGRRLAHVVADHDPGGALGPHQPGEGGADIGDEPRVDLFAHHPADVISLDHGVHEFAGARDSRHSPTLNGAVT